MMILKWVQNAPQGGFLRHLKGKDNVWQRWLSLAFFRKSNTWPFKLDMCSLWSMSCICPRTTIKLEHHIYRWQRHDAVLNFDTFVVNKVCRVRIRDLMFQNMTHPLRNASVGRNVLSERNHMGYKWHKKFGFKLSGAMFTVLHTRMPPYSYWNWCISNFLLLYPFFYVSIPLFFWIKMFILYHLQINVTCFLFLIFDFKDKY